MRIYESTRDKECKASASSAILNGLAQDGGLYMLRDLEELKIDLNAILNLDYYEIAELVLGKLLDDYSAEEIHDCVHAAYEHKFEAEDITPLVKVGDIYLLELFHGPTSAFKDVALSILPHLVTTALKKHGVDDEIIILTATSGDTGKAALAGFKDVENTKIMVFYPEEGVSAVQKRQMETQAGSNVCVASIKGNFDDAQSSVKQIFTNHELASSMKENHQQFSSANSINIGRLTPQVVYYFKAYADLVNRNEIKLGEEVNFVVPTGNFGNILAGYLAKQMGLPVAKFICASNENNILTDFIKTGIYDRNRDFKKTLSPSMDILISSNLERLLYLLCGCDDKQVSQWMNDLQNKGKYEIGEQLLHVLQQDFWADCADDVKTKAMIKECYEANGYLMDTHTAVAYAAAMKFKEQQINDKKLIVLSTASPYKFVGSVYEAINNQHEEDEFALMNKLNTLTGVDIPKNLAHLNEMPILHNNHLAKEEMEQFVKMKLEEKQW